MRFEHKSVVITGGSSGIGSAAVRIFAQKGAKVMVSGRSGQRCRQVCDEMAALGHRVEKITGD
jgi:NAD(P)-dependent dehydrogenase (short-subunit alcohol dehydrogenase family)